MNTQTTSTNPTRVFLVGAAAMTMLLFVSIMPSFGQNERATSSEGLTASGFMTSADVSDDIEGTDDEYFYKFQTVPGKLTLTLWITAEETNAGATLDLFGANAKAILSNMLVQSADRGTQRSSQTVNLAKAQTIIIRIKGMRYGSSDGYPGIYKIRLEGTAVNFKEAGPSEPPAEVKKPDGVPTDETDENKKADVPPSDVLDKKPSTTPSGATGQDKMPTSTLPDETGQNKKPDTVDRVIEKGKAKSNKLIELLKKVKAKIPD